MKLKNKNKHSPPFLSIAVPAVFCTMLWGTAFPGIKSGYELFDIGKDDVGSKLLFAGLRFFTAGLIVLAIGVLKKHDDERIIPQKIDIIPISLLGFFQTFLQYFLLYLGISTVSGTKSSLYTSAAAFATVLISPLCFRQDKLSFQKISGCIIGVGGIVFMSVYDGGLGGFTLSGDGLVILSNLSGAAGNIISKKISVNGRSAVLISSWQLIFGGIGLTVCGLAFGGRLPFESFGGWIILFYLAAMAGIAFMIWTELLRKNPVSRVAVFNLLIPLFGTMWSGIFLHEDILRFSNLAALILVCSGIFLVNKSKKALLVKEIKKIDNSSERKKDSLF